MANMPQAQTPAIQESTSSARPIHRIEVDGVCVSLFPDGRATVQRYYANKGGKTGYANSLRPQNWASARRALELLEQWYAEYQGAEKSKGNA